MDSTSRSPKKCVQMFERCKCMSVKDAYVIFNLYFIIIFLAVTKELEGTWAASSYLKLSNDDLFILLTTIENNFNNNHHHHYCRLTDTHMHPPLRASQLLGELITATALPWWRIQPPATWHDGWETERGRTWQMSTQSDTENRINAQSSQLLFVHDLMVL